MRRIAYLIVLFAALLLIWSADRGMVEVLAGLTAVLAAGLYQFDRDWSQPGAWIFWKL